MKREHWWWQKKKVGINGIKCRYNLVSPKNEFENQNEKETSRHTKEEEKRDINNYKDYCISNRYFFLFKNTIYKTYLHLSST